MKRCILFFPTFVLVVALNAQRQHTHFKRVKIERQEVSDTVLSNERIKDDEIIVIEKSALEILPAGLELKADHSRFQKLKPRKRPMQVHEVDVQQMSSTTFLQKLLDTHHKIQKVGETQNVMLRTWKWLLIAACILLAIGIFIIIMPYIKIKGVKEPVMWIGVGIGIFALLAALIVLILGLSGRI